MLGSTPGIENGYLVDTGDGAVRRAGFFGEVFAAEVFASVVLEGNSGIAALLRTVMN